MIIEALIVSAYRGTSKARQRKIVQDLGFNNEQGSLIWSARADTAEEVRRIESALRGKVPYVKVREEAV